jgi:hypothetical protein
MAKDFKKFKKDDKDKSSNKSKNKGRSKGYQKQKSGACEEEIKGNINDASHYFSNPELLAQVTNIAFNEYLGVPANYDSTYEGVDLVEKVANVSTFYMNPSVQPTGYESTARYAAINVVGFKNFLLLSSNNAKTTSYAPQDVTCLILAIGQILAMYSYLRRPFGCIYMINQRNRSYPELLFKAMGIDYDDFKQNVADYRIKFNQLIAMFDRIPFFSEIPYFDKCVKMFDNIYVDEDTPLAQTYMFVPQTTWTIDEAYNPQGTGLTTTEVVSKSTTKKFSEYLNIFADMINALATSSTFNAIFSDVLRVVQNGKGKTIALEVIGEGYSITPVINVEIRHWINNAKFIHLPDDKDAFPGSLGIGATNYNDVASLANQNGIIYNPIFSLGGSDHNAETFTATATQPKALSASYENDLVNFDSMAPSVEDKISATRLAVRAHIKSTNAPTAGQVFLTLDEIGLGDYYCTGMLVYTDVNSDPFVINENVQGINTMTDTNPSINGKHFIQMADLLTKLKYAPRVKAIAWDLALKDGDNYLLSEIGDLSYYTFLDWKYMKRFKDVEALTLFAINI